MKIGLVITDLQIGGTPTVVRELAIRLPASVISLAAGGPVADQIRDAGRPVFSLGVSRALDFPLAVSRLVHLIHAEQFDVILSFLIHANTIAASASLFCRNTRFLQSIQTTQPTPRWHWKLQSIIQHAAEKIVVPSPSVAQVATRWSSIPLEKLIVIANAVDLSPSPGIPGEGGGEGDFAVGTTLDVRIRPHPNPLPAYRERGPEHSPCIGFIGRLDPIKRICDLVSAIAKLPNYRLDIFGEGPGRVSLQQQINRLNLSNRVTLRGAVASPAEALSQIDILVLPSAAEGFGLVLIEAMAAGVPVIATDVPGIRDVVQNNLNGLLVSVGNPAALAAAIVQLSTEDPLRQRLIANARRHVEINFTWDRILPQYRRLLDAYHPIPL